MTRTVIRAYQEPDAPAVGLLIADTYADYNLDFLDPEEVGAYLGPFRHADSADPEHRQAIADAIYSHTVLVAERDGKVVGVLRGRPGRLASLFVCGDCQRQGIGRQLVNHFEQGAIEAGVKVIRVAVTLYGVPFYSAMGYRRSTGVRLGHSFEGTSLPYQPMRKVIS